MSARGSAVCLLSAVLLALAPASALAFSEVITPAEAVDRAVEIDADSSPVTIEGEAIGEALVAPRGKRWVNLRGDGLAIGVVVEQADAERIPLWGEYRWRGATIRVSGTLQRACSEHGGDLDVHARTFEIVDAGGPIARTIHPVKGGLAAIGMTVSLALWARYRRLRRRALLA